MIYDQWASPFEPRDPNPARCCFCHSHEGPFTIDVRPSGPNFSMQSWPICPRCWDLIHQPAELRIPDPSASATITEPIEEEEIDDRPISFDLQAL
jgi:hypothetical protein